MIAVPRLCFAQLPTPVERLIRLTNELKGPRISIKRDDQTGLAFGGNKTRKLEFLLADAQTHGARTLITAGAVQSNHCRQTAACAAKFGFDCILVLTTEKENETENKQISGNLLLDYLFGAKIIFTKKENRSIILEEIYHTAWKEGQKPYLIPYGGSNHVGATAYAIFIKELQSQGIKPDWIVCASSSGGTQAGLILGSMLYNFPVRILGISIDEQAGSLQKKISTLVCETADWLGEKVFIDPEQVLVNDQYLGEGYGILGKLERESIRLFAQKEGLLLDPVYTGRAAGGMVDLIRKNYFGVGEEILFLHSGGTPALFASIYNDKLSRSDD